MEDGNKALLLLGDCASHNDAIPRMCEALSGEIYQVEWFKLHRGVTIRTKIIFPDSSEVFVSKFINNTLMVSSTNYKVINREGEINLCVAF